ncbi:MAG: bifunctional riboflavin kinase/FAD synthetase [Clostridia bacterium]|nr:bifunctional riboflavin kinase/FAD synthetase [Clostridia bacterium]
MEIIDIEDFSLISEYQFKTVVALGNFDGVHKAHKTILESAAGTARVMTAVPAVFTFKKSGKPEIVPYEERKKLIGSCGIELLFEADFEKVKNVDCRTFFEEYVLKRMNAVHLVCGYNYRFGHMAKGDAGILDALCQEYGIGLTVISEIDSDGCAVSSSRIRDALISGDMEKANRLLGRPYSIVSEIVHGKSEGHRHGIPTINLVFKDESLIPAFGVYVTKCYINGKEFRSVCNVGVAPTFGSDQSKPVCEVYLFDFDGDVYGDIAQVEFLHFLRKEKRFSDVSALYDRIKRDIDEAKSYFKVKD